MTSGFTMQALDDDSQFESVRASEKRPHRVYRWYHKLAGVMAAIFCFELGVFLVFFPWASYWNISYFPFLPIWAREIWVNPYFRGAVSGVGLLNVYISFLEVSRLRRFSV